MIIVARKNTPLTAAQAAAAVREAYASFFDEEPTRKTLELLLALVWTETGAGRSCQNFNVGNITAGSSFAGAAFRPPWFDLEGGTAATERNVRLHELMLEGKAPSAFRAYDSLTAGCADFVRILNRSFPEVLEAAADGDADEFREALSEKYSKDYENPRVTETLRQFQFQFRTLLETGGDGEERGFPFVKVIGVVAIAAAAGGFLYFHFRAPKPGAEPKEAAA